MVSQRRLFLGIHLGVGRRVDLLLRSAGGWVVRWSCNGGRSWEITLGRSSTKLCKTVVILFIAAVFELERFGKSWQNSLFKGTLR